MYTLIKWIFGGLFYKVTYPWVETSEGYLTFWDLPYDRVCQCSLISGSSLFLGTSFTASSRILTVMCDHMTEFWSMPCEWKWYVPLRDKAQKSLVFFSCDLAMTVQDSKDLGEAPGSELVSWNWNYPCLHDHQPSWNYKMIEIFEFLCHSDFRLYIL